MYCPRSYSLNLVDFPTLIFSEPIPVAERSKERICCHSFAGLAGSKPAGGMDVYLLCLLCAVRYRLCDGRSLVQSVIYISECDLEI